MLSRAIVVPADITTVDLAETERRKAAARERRDPSSISTRVARRHPCRVSWPGWEELRGTRRPNQNLNEADIDRLSSIIREVGEGYIYDDSDAERLQNEIVLVDARIPPRR